MEHFDETFNSAKDIIKIVMTEQGRARNDDDFLITEVKKIDPRIKSESIVRIRRVIQNQDGELLPTLSGVLVRRRFKEAEIKNFFGSTHEIYKSYLEYKYGNGVIAINDGMGKKMQ
jgi:hypothetical protein